MQEFRMTEPEHKLLGVDFTSRPSARKRITAAEGVCQGRVVRLTTLHSFKSLLEFEQFLQAAPAWIGAFDFPFGLPRELVQTLGWPVEWLPLMQHYCALPRSEVRAQFKAFCDSRPSGSKFAHRTTDGPAGASPSMKWVNPPVAYMLHAGVPCLLGARAHIPLLHASGGSRIALEGYPGLLARECVGRASYKSDDSARNTPERLIARKDILTALEAGRTRLGLRLKLSPTQAHSLADDASGDMLDAVLCLMQAAWSALQGAPRYGIPSHADALEGWIITADLYA
jgi:hypothetical protein